MLLNLELSRLDEKNYPFIKLECMNYLRELLNEVDISDHVTGHWFDRNYFVIEESPYAKF